MTYLINGTDPRAGVRGGGPIGTYHNNLVGLGIDKDLLKVAKVVAAAGSAGADVVVFKEQIDAAGAARQRYFDKLKADQAAWDAVAGPIRRALEQQVRAGVAAMKLPAGMVADMVNKQVSAQLASQLQQRGLGPRPPEKPYPAAPPVPVLPTIIVGGKSTTFSTQGAGVSLEPAGDNKMLYIGGAALVIGLLVLRKK